MDASLFAVFAVAAAKAATLIEIVPCLLQIRISVLLSTYTTTCSSHNTTVLARDGIAAD